MKTLTKIKLINRHIFQNETIDIKGNTLIFGENGSGKSTLIDAIHYVIDGGKDVKFNTAANTSNKNKRTIESYMRLKIGVEGKEYLRNGNVITHVALEFYDTISRESSVIGVCLELVKGNNKASERFYQLLKCKIDDSYYLANSEDKTFKVNNFTEFSKIIENKNIKMNIFDDSKRDNCAKIHRALNLFDENSTTYSVLLNKAISFKPIDDVNEFVYSYLMPEKDIDLNNLIVSIRSYREIRELVLKEDRKKELLENVLNNGSELEKKEDKKLCYEFILNEREARVSEKEYKNKQINLSTLESKIKDITSKKDFLESEKDILERNKYAYENNTLNIHYQNLITLKEREKRDLESLKIKLDNFNAKIDFETSIINYFGLDINLEKYKNSLDLQGYTKEITDYNQLLKEDIEPSLKENKLEIEHNLKKVFDSKNSLLKTKEELEDYHTSFKDAIGIDLNGFIELVKKEFFEKYKTDLEIGPLCYYIEIKNEYENKRNLLEQFLANRRFDIILNGRYFDFVSKIYNENRDKYESLSLINLNKFDTDLEVKENSLFNYFEYNSIEAEKYAKGILGEAFERESFADFELNNKETTDDGFVYLKNKLIKRPKKIAKLPYIGINSFKERLERCLKDIALVDEEIKKNKDKVNDIVSKLNFISKSNVLTLSNTDCFVYPEFDYKKTTIEKLDDEIKAMINENKDLAEISLKIESLANEISQKSILIRQIENELINKRAEYKSCEETLEKSKIRYEESVNALSELRNNSRMTFIKERYYEETNLLTNDLINKKLKDIGNELFLIRNNLVESMKVYNLEFGESFIPRVESYKDYKELYNKTIKTNLTKYNSQLLEAQEKAIQGFKEDYISKIRKYIYEEKEHIDKLNKVLKSKPFGTDGDVYEFIMQRNKKEELGRFYDIFVSSSDFEPKNLFSTSLDKKDEDAMMELFDTFTSDKNNNIEKERMLKLYSDYRSFMSYDIKIKYNNDEISYFSKVSNEKSGGETQTPFYIIIAASFEQIFTASARFNKRESPFGLVILDEAFNNMDEQRIEAMVSYFKTLNEQFLIVVPSQRASIMMNYFDTTIALAKHNNRAILIEDLHQDEQNQ